MKKKLTNIVVALVAMAGVSLGGAQSASADMVGHIYCITPTQCVKDYYEPGGYWMAKNYAGWVRLTMVPGADNSHVAPITCTNHSCIVVYYDWPKGAGYYMARQYNGTVWVRLTRN